MANQGIKMWKWSRHRNILVVLDKITVWLLVLQKQRQGGLDLNPFFTSKSSLQDSFRKLFQLWLMSVLNKQLSSLGIFQFLVGWQRKDMQHRGRNELICLTFAGPHGCTSLKAAAFTHPHSQYWLVYQVEAAGLTDRKYLVLGASNTYLQRFPIIELSAKNSGCSEPGAGSSLARVPPMDTGKTESSQVLYPPQSFVCKVLLNLCCTPDSSYESI